MGQSLQSQRMMGNKLGLGNPGRPSVPHADWRARLGDVVLRHTTDARRRELMEGVPPEVAQEIIEEYDPLEQLAIISIDHRVPLGTRVSCLGEVAQYMRPKLKSVEITAPPQAPEEVAARRETAFRIIQALTQRAGDQRDKYEEQLP